MERALLVDYGGVLTSPILPSFAAFCDAEGIPRETFFDVLRAAVGAADSPFALIETGAITPRAFDESFAAMLTEACGREVPSSGLKRRLFAAVSPDTAMHDAVRAARAAGVRTVLLSNSWGGRDDYPLDQIGALFDDLVISGEVGLRKPDAAIYHLGAERAGVSVEACVFIDDLEHNVEGARAVGMVGVHHVDAARTIGELEAALGLPLRA